MYTPYTRTRRSGVHDITIIWKPADYLRAHNALKTASLEDYLTEKVSQTSLGQRWHGSCLLFFTVRNRLSPHIHSTAAPRQLQAFELEAEFRMTFSLAQIKPNWGF